MDDNLLGYLLDALDPAARRQVEERLAGDPEACARLDLLRRALAPLAADRAPCVPPPGLAERTLRLVAAHAPGDMPRVPGEGGRRSFGTHRGWRRADVLVAALVLLAALTLAVPFVLNLRKEDGAIQCKYNLNQFYQALRGYHDHHGRFPNVSDIDAPTQVAGLMVPLLIGKGYLPNTASVQCPSVAAPSPCPFSLAQVRAMDTGEFRTAAGQLNPGYAYSLGYRPGGGGPVVSLALDRGKPDYLRPLMADCPDRDALKGNSPNHGGKGQHVLYVDGSVKFCTTRALDGDDLYLNKVKKVAAGLDKDDAVLGDSASCPAEIP